MGVLVSLNDLQSNRKMRINLFIVHLVLVILEDCHLIIVNVSNETRGLLLHVAVNWQQLLLKSSFVFLDFVSLSFDSPFIQYE